MEYLPGVQFTNITNKELYPRLHIMDADYIKTLVFAAIKTLIDDKALECKKEWKACKGDCYKTLYQLVQTETHSTEYILKALSMMVLSIEEKKILFTLKSDITNLSGIWEHDSQYIQMERFNDISARLIMGFGPSASGKTYWAKNLITILSQNSTFPKTFLSIDGGILREASLVYQTIINAIKTQCIAGLDNLVLSNFSLLSGSIFDSEKIKPVILKYLETQEKFPIYFPETLGGCGSMRPKACDEKINKYVKLTGDENWIGVFIWQHLHGSQCTYEGEQKCVGCSESGRAREIKEGKKYSEISYEHSYTQGLKELAKAPGGQYNIHNCGRPDGKSTIKFNGDNEFLVTLNKEENRDKYKYIVLEERGGRRRHTRRKRRSRRRSKKHL
jgi:hypothetical protein